MRESRTYGFVRGAHSDMRPYRDPYLSRLGSRMWAMMLVPVLIRSPYDIPLWLLVAARLPFRFGVERYLRPRHSLLVL